MDSTAMLLAKMEALSKDLDGIMGYHGVEEVDHAFYGCEYCGGPHQTAQCPSYFNEGLYYTQGNPDQWAYQGGYNDWMPQQQHSGFPCSDQPYYYQTPPPPPPSSRLESLLEQAIHEMHTYQAPQEQTYYEPPPPPPPSELELIFESFMQAQLASDQANEDRLTKLEAQLEEIAASQNATANQLAQMVSSGRFEAYDSDEEYQKEDESDATFLHICEDDEIPLTKPTDEMVEKIVELEEQDGFEVIDDAIHLADEKEIDFISVVDVDTRIKEEILAKHVMENCASLSENPCDAPYILEFILEPKVWNMECAQYYHKIREPTRVPRAKMLLRRFPQYRWYH